jgi:hypothetical protein
VPNAVPHKVLVTFTESELLTSDAQLPGTAVDLSARYLSAQEISLPPIQAILISDRVVTRRFLMIEPSVGDDADFYWLLV